MKTIITLFLALSLIFSSCTKNVHEPIPEPTKYENLYDTNATKRFIDLYVTTEGNTIVSVNQKVLSTGIDVKAFNAYNGDTVKVQVINSSNTYNQVLIRKNYTSVIDTICNGTTINVSYIVH